MKFSNPFGRSPELQKVIDAEKERIRKEGDVILERIETAKQAKMAANRAEHGAKMAELDAQISQRKKEILDSQKDILLKMACNSLQMSLYGPLSSAMKNKLPPMADRLSATEDTRKNLEKKAAELKEDPSTQTFAALEQWALAEVGEDEKAAQEVEKAFQEFKEKLQKDEILLEAGNA